MMRCLSGHLSGDHSIESKFPAKVRLLDAKIVLQKTSGISDQNGRFLIGLRNPPISQRGYSDAISAILPGPEVNHAHPQTSYNLGAQPANTQQQGILKS